MMNNYMDSFTRKDERKMAAGLLFIAFLAFAYIGTKVYEKQVLQNDVSTTYSMNLGSYSNGLRQR